MKTELLDGKVVVYAGDCLETIKNMSDNSVDSIVTDPPYHFQSIVDRFGKKGSAPAKFGSDGAFARASSGFREKEWDGGDIAFRKETWAEFMRVLKPGGHMVAFAATKNSHKMVTAIEDAGFEIRDSLMWLYGTGMPKSHKISTFLTKKKGDFAEEAEQWQGWQTALKPAFEPICLARKPLSEKRIADNILVHGVGAINIDACRFSDENRYPANVMHDDGEDTTADMPNGASRYFYSAKTSKAERKGSNHPTVKPLALMRYLCKMITPAGGTVLDPFAGTGATGEAAYLDGFNSIMLEMDNDYVKDIISRFDEYKG